MVKTWKNNKWLLIGTAAVLAVIALIVIVSLSKPDAVLDTEQAFNSVSEPAEQISENPGNDIAPIQAGQAGDAPVNNATTPGGQADNSAGDDIAAAPGWQTHANPVDDNAVVPSGQADITTAGDNAAMPSGQSGKNSTGDNAATPSGQAGKNSAGDNAAAPSGQAGKNAAGDNAAPPSGQANKDPVRETITVSQGQTEFSIIVSVNELTSYAGIEFALTLSDEAAQTFSSFTPSLSSASSSPFITENGKHYFGFYAGLNAFTADSTSVGDLNFENYISDKTLTITIVQMAVSRLNEKNEVVTTEKESPVYVFTVKRETNG